MKALNIPVPLALSPFVNGVYVYTQDNGGHEVFSLPVYADGCPGIVFYEGDKGLYLNNSRRLERLFVYGQGVKPIALSTTGAFRLLVFILQPYALKTLFNIDAHYITDSCIAMHNISPKTAHTLEAHLSEALSTQQRISIMSAFIRHLDRNTISRGRDVQYAVRLIVENNGLVPLQTIHNELRVTERTFQRRFEQHIGVSPKLFCRICQFQASISQLTTQGFGKLSDVAYDNGYADQSHFIRVFKEFTNHTPKEFLRTQTMQLIPAATNHNAQHSPASDFYQ